MLRDQNGKEKAHYRKEKSKMEREIFHYSNCEAFLDIKAIARVSQDSDHRNGDYMHLSHNILNPEMPMRTDELQLHIKTITRYLLGINSALPTLCSRQFSLFHMVNTTIPHYCCNTQQHFEVLLS